MKRNQSKSWFDVDKDGLAKLQARRSKVFILYELLQNCWDQNVSTVNVLLHKYHAPRVHIVVEDDDPDGFADLSHAFTLFAESNKKSDPSKRGRFNLGEKLVLSLCSEASITTTTGRVYFDKDGRHRDNLRRRKGSEFSGYLKMTGPEFEECITGMRQLIVPSHIQMHFSIIRNDSEEVEQLPIQLPVRTPITTTEASLRTETADNEGYLRPTVRKTSIEIYRPHEGEVGTLYEMGIPVVETGDTYHINIGQKIPLTIERDNVTPAYLRDVRTIVLNSIHNHISQDDANKSWVRDALSDENITPGAVKTIVHHRFGDKAVAFDPRDQEANKRAVSKGYVVVTGNQFSKSEWLNIRAAGVLPAAGQVTPTPKPFTEGGDPAEIIHTEDMTEAEARVIKTIRKISNTLLGFTPNILLVKRMNRGTIAAYGHHCLYLSRSQLGKEWFEFCLQDKRMTTRALDLLIHELGHEFCPDHLSSKYYDALTNLGAKLALAVADNPKLLDV